MNKYLSKLKRQHLIILLILALIALLSIFPAALGNFVYWQDDIHFHVNRLESYAEALKHLDFFPRIFSSMGNNFGYAADLFYPSILLAPYGLFRLLGCNFSQAFYLFHFTVSFITAGIAFLCCKKFGQPVKVSLLFSALYTLSTYRLIDQNVRGALGETIAFAFIPLVFFALHQILFAKKNNWLLLASSLTFLIASHLITAFYTVIAVITFFGIWTLNAKKAAIKLAFITLVKAAAATLLFSAWFWLPYLEQVSAIAFNFSKTSLWSSGLDFSLGTLLQNTISNAGRSADGLEPNFGILILIAIIAGLLLFKKISKTEKLLLAITIVFILLSTNLFFWSLFKDTFLAVVQFPWRLLIFVSFFGSLLAALLVNRLINLENKFNFILAIWAICFLTISFNGNVYARSEYNQSSFLDNENYTDFDSSQLGHGKEYIKKDTPANYLLQNPYPKINDFHQYRTLITHSYQKDTYELTTTDATALELPKFYYLGYQIEVNGTPTDYYEQNGVIGIDVPAGENKIEVVYGGTEIQRYGIWLSLGSLMIISIGKIALYLKAKKV